jgi:hypothetical protein
MTGGTLENHMRLISISFTPASDDSNPTALFKRLLQLGAVEVQPSHQWLLHTRRTAPEVRDDLRTHIDPSDHLLVIQVAEMAFQQLINQDRFRSGVA